MMRGLCLGRSHLSRWPRVSSRRYLEGQAPSEALAEEAALFAVRDAQPLARNRLKVEVVKALVRKAILNAAD